MDVTVAIGTYGEDAWAQLAHERAIPSIPEGVRWRHVHRPDGTLAEARNATLREVSTEWVCHLDADDELAPDYFERMAEGTADMRVPAVEHLFNGRPSGPPAVPQVWSHEHACEGECLRFGNWMCIGTVVKTKLAVEWEEFGWSEDYAFFARIWKNGATAEAIPKAIYRAYHTRGGRNRVSRETGLYWHREIEKAVWPEEPSILG